MNKFHILPCRPCPSRPKTVYVLRSTNVSNDTRERENVDVGCEMKIIAAIDDDFEMLKHFSHVFTTDFTYMSRRCAVPPFTTIRRL